MSATLSIPSAQFAPALTQHTRVVLKGISWKTYSALLEEVAEQQIFLTFDQGRLEIVSPSSQHERWKSLIGRLISVMALDLDIPVALRGSTTFRREDLQRGLEPDECFYIQHEKAVREKTEINLPQDPPPDLVVEIDFRHHAIDRESIYAAMGVPEVWRFGGDKLEFLHLSDRIYVVKDASAAFPFLRAADLERFIRKPMGMGDTAILKSFQEWVRTLKR